MESDTEFARGKELSRKKRVTYVRKSGGKKSVWLRVTGTGT